ncbi:hypothetical protein SAMN04488008_101340 [Maribacter orientalis]|uniref:Uncharacterized protein n=1 Tax=Maribacter orientalis TaxID=228957 RepID=A0A1H7GH03_9FLAO|nr:hypothetical protein SAMN04488008_101340 [Maribacter orientalis]
MAIDDFGFLTIVFLVLSNTPASKTKANILVYIIDSVFLYFDLCHRRYML